MQLFKRKSVLILLMAMSFLVSCATMGTQMSPKQQALVWMSVYNSQYNDVSAMLFNPSAKPEQKEMAQKKAQILKQVWPLLKEYRDIAALNGTPSAQTEYEINRLINQLTLIAIGG